MSYFGAKDIWIVFIEEALIICIFSQHPNLVYRVVSTFHGINGIIYILCFEK